MSPIKNIYMHFSSLPDPLKSPTLEIFQIFFFFCSPIGIGNQLQKKKPKNQKVKLELFQSSGKGDF